MEKKVTATMKKATAIVLSVAIAAAFWWAVLGNSAENGAWHHLGDD